MRMSKEQKYTVNGVSFNMIHVEGGTFMMGAQEEWCVGNSREHPSHSVTLDSFYIAETEVTQELWEVVMGNNPSSTKGLHHPVESVAWDDCWEFINRLNAFTGKTFRLPTEAEWEYAARGGCESKGYKYSGSDDLNEVGWYWGNYDITTHDVATRKPNELGLYDMSGNVYEWCKDWYGDYDSHSQTNPQGPFEGSTHVCRGGCMCLLGYFCRVSDRGLLEPDGFKSCIGLRLALSEEEIIPTLMEVNNDDL